MQKQIIPILLTILCAALWVVGVYEASIGHEYGLAISGAGFAVAVVGVGSMFKE
ncbi:MAG: hypothetical protein QXR69_03980 [Conexivisphaerales archaeon]